MRHTTAGKATKALQKMVDDFSQQYQARYGYVWNYHRATVYREGKHYFLTVGGIVYFLNTRQHAEAHLKSYLETGTRNMAMLRMGTAVGQ